jgi:DsbC/DsbD-like thiol-disulfide interchange protein
MRLTCALLTLLAATGTAVAGASPWQDLAPGVRIRLLSDDVRQADGTTMLALELDMPATTRTYWRVPGEGGIPAEIDLAGSRGLGALDPVWPYPTVDHTAGYTDFVYFGPTVLPLTAHLDAAAVEVKAAVTLGVCSDICMPARAELSLPLDFARADPGQQLRIAQAVALAPIAWQGPGEGIGTVTLDAAAGTLAVEVLAPDIDPASVIADMGPDGMLFGAPQKSPESGVVALPLLGGGDVGGLVGQPVRLTFLTPAGAYETTRTIAVRSAASQ